MYREVTEKAEADLQKYKRNETIISEYKQICSQQSERLEKLQQERRDDLLHLKVCQPVLEKMTVWYTSTYVIKFEGKPVGKIWLL